MDIFHLREQLIHDYSAYTSSFIHIQDQRIREHVEQGLRAGVLQQFPAEPKTPKNGGRGAGVFAL